MGNLFSAARRLIFVFGMALLVPAVVQAKCDTSQHNAACTAIAVHPTQPAASVPPVPAKPAPAVQASPHEGAAIEIDWDMVKLWAVVAFITVLATFVAVYPIGFYIVQVWKSRRSAIFNTLKTPAKALYLKLYHSSELTDPNDEEQVKKDFAAVYRHWFGRGRLLVPTWIIGILTASYAFILAIFAVKALFVDDPDISRLPFSNDLGDTRVLVAIAAMSGAYVLVTMDSIQRVTRRDLLPDDLHLTALRLAACVPLGYAFASILGDNHAAPLVALALSAFPLQQIAGFLQQLGAKQINITLPSSTPSLDPPSRLSGVDQAVCERLSAIGVNTITQIAYSDPVQLTMRTSLQFVFVLDMVSQALAWVYLEQKLDAIRAGGLRGAFEIAVFKRELDDPANPNNANAQALMAELPRLLSMSDPEIRNMMHEAVDDPYVVFLLVAYA